MAVAYIVRSYPRLSQTFILNEILALERLGLRIEIFGMTDPGEPVVQSGVGEVRAPARYLDSAVRRRLWAIVAEHVRVAARSPRRYAATAAYVLRRRDLDRGYTTASRFTCFVQAVYLARLIGARNGATRIAHIHSHFAHDPTLTALLVKRLTGVPYSFTAHARDLYQTPVRALAERVHEATAVVTCCAANRRYLERAVPAGRAKLELIHHGVDVRTFHPQVNGHGPAAPLILSVGRLVEKKGFGDLIRACDLLNRRGVRFECVIYGDGPLRERLLELIEQLGLEADVRLAGARPQAELTDELARATVFALAPKVTDDGDRDGIPNVLVEAMACGLAVASTAAGGVPELVIHGRTGLLAAPGDVAGIADNLAALIGRPALRRRLGSHARKMVAEGFDVEANARRLVPILTATEGTG
jgi:glycosyltransferase involved in cell wall biosynthesis